MASARTNARRLIAGLCLSACVGAAAAAEPVFVSSESPHFVFHYVKGSAAERDLALIAANRERAYGIIAAALQAPAGGKISVTLYPDRESTRSGFSEGSTDKDVIRVNYFDFTPSYEQTRYGHELTHALSYRTLHGDQSVPLLAEGLAEYMDQSGRNMHEWLSYETRIHGDRPPVRVESSDLYSGKQDFSYTKAGSFVKFLIEDSGWEKFRTFYKATREIGKLAPRERFPKFAARFQEAYGRTLESAESDWNKAVAAFDAKELPRLPAPDEAAVRELFSTQDAAAAAKDAKTFSNTYDRIGRTRIGYFEGNLRYYMDHLPTTQSLEIDSLGIKNGLEATVIAVRKFKDGRTVNIQYRVEKLEDGWKIQDEDW
jgi:hypothetical protein